MTANPPPASTFSSIPNLSLASARDSKTKPAFLAALRDALLNVGFLYLSDTELPDELVERVCEEAKRFFEELPLEEKERIEMKHQKSFLGWSRVSGPFSVLLLGLQERCLLWRFVDSYVSCYWEEAVKLCSWCKAENCVLSSNSILLLSSVQIVSMLCISYPVPSNPNP